MIGHDLFNEATHTYYPFSVPGTEVLKSVVVDASVYISASLAHYTSNQASGNVRLRTLTYADGSPTRMRVEIYDSLFASQVVVIPETNPVTTSAFGEFDIVTSAYNGSQVTLVLNRNYRGVNSNFNDAFFLQGLIATALLGNVVTGFNAGTKDAEGIEGFEEVVYDDGFLTLQSGDYMVYEVDNTDPDNPEIVLTAVQPVLTPENCKERTKNMRPPLRSFNGVRPDEYGNINIYPSGVWLVDATDEAAFDGTAGLDVGLKLSNVGEACCDCDDYAAYFNKLRDAHQRLEATRTWLVDVQGRYIALLRYVKMLLTAPIVGDKVVGGGSRVEECRD